MERFRADRGGDGGVRFIAATTDVECVCATEEAAGVLASAACDRFILLLEGCASSWSGAGLVGAIADGLGLLLLVVDEDAEGFLEWGMCMPRDGSDSDLRRVL